MSNTVIADRHEDALKAVNRKRAARRTTTVKLPKGATSTHPLHQKDQARKESTSVAVFGPNLGKGATFHVMAATDRKRKFAPYKDHEPLILKAKTLEAIVKEVYADQIAEGTSLESVMDDFDVLPSAKHLLPAKAVKPRSSSGPRPRLTDRWLTASGDEVVMGAKVSVAGLTGKVVSRFTHKPKSGGTIPFLTVAVEKVPAKATAALAEPGATDTDKIRPLTKAGRLACAADQVTIA